MSGNVWEWCADWFDEKYYAKCKKQGIVENPKGPDEGVYRVRRGGSCWNVPQLCRVASRISSHPVARYDGIGFRLAASFQSVD